MTDHPKEGLVGGTSPGTCRGRKESSQVGDGSTTLPVRASGDSSDLVWGVRTVLTQQFDQLDQIMDTVKFYE